jgi:CHAT domain-containing protein/tetratricopeptide (TPR) repeat protein
MQDRLEQLAERLAQMDEPWRRRALLREHTGADLDIGMLVRCALARRREDPEGARRIATGAFCVAQSTGRGRESRMAAKMLAQTHIIRGQPVRALARLNSIRIAAPQQEGLRLALEFAQTFSHLARFDDALRVIHEARAELPQRGTADYRARLSVIEGLVHQAKGSSSEALVAFERGRKVLARLKVHHALTTIDINRATALTNLEEYDKAERLYRRCIRDLRLAGRPMHAARAAYNHAYLRFARGYFHDALSQFRTLRGEFEAACERRYVAMCDLDEAEISLHMNLPAHASELANRAAGVLDQLGMPAEAARAEFFCSVAARSLQEIPEARHRMERAEKAFRLLDNGMWWGISLHRLAELDLTTGNAGRAARRAARASELLRSCGLRERAGYAEVLLATIERASGENEASGTRLEKLLAELGDHPLPWLRCEIHHGLARVCAQKGEAQAAETHILRATNLLERHRVAVPPDEYMAAFLTGKAELFRDAVQMVLNVGGEKAEERAFELAEQARGRALLDLLRHEQPQRGRSSTAALEREALRLEREIDGLGSRMPAIDRGTEASDLDRRAEEASRREARLRACLDRLSRRDPASARLRRGAAPRLEDVRASLTEDETLVEYFVANEELLIFVVDKTSLHVERRPLPLDEFAGLLRRTSFQLNRPSVFDRYDEGMVQAVERSAHKVLSELHDLLLAPIRHLLRTPRIVIVPHGELNGIPFHALEAEGEPLLAAHEVVQVPSASIYVHCRRERRPGTRTSLLLGVPDEIAPDIRREIEELRAFVPHQRSFVGREATVEVLARYGRRARLIHIAAHARFRHDDPMESGVRLGDGWLTIPRIAQLRLRPDLIVLAGCATGRVSVTEGGEVFGLVRGFLQAGAASILTSLWPVPDTETTEFMHAFHRRLADGEAPAAALRASALELRSRKPHPFYWAPFILLGRGS